MAFKVFDPTKKIENMYSTVAEPMWSTGGNLTTFFTGSTQDTNSGKYYYDVHATSDQTTDVEFAITYGHELGSGSEGSTVGGTTNPTKAIYSQLRQVLLPAQTTQFNFHGDSGTDYKVEDVFGISISRSQYREKVDPGNWELHLKSGSRSIRLIDDSNANRNPQLGNAKREFNVVSGSIANGTHTTAASTATGTGAGSYGLFYPEMGMIVLNPNSLASGSVNTDPSAFIKPLVKSTSTNNLNHRNLFDSIKSGSYFSARREEQKRSSFYFCDILADEFNHSQNPSFFTGSNAELVNSSFKTEPVTYITTVGLYNDNNELLAVAKLSIPFKKDINTEALIKVRLDY
jgi:hypothetical protein|tara:strand:- start:638 stop:1672 length:1035 start_codon:yes stop_codon:yes gene_type:complete